MEHYDPLSQNSQEPLEPQESVYAAPPQEDGFTPPARDPLGTPGYTIGQKPKKSGGAARKTVALCLVCALLGGLGGGGLVMGLQGGTNPGAIHYGNRTPAPLSTISADTKTAMTVPEVYANYVDSCVGITVDLVTTNLFGQRVQSAAAGSGFVITEDGYIVTNYHVIKGADSITVTFVDGTSFPATLVGGEEDNDVAVIKINAAGLHPVILGDSTDMYVGETVVTIGNPLGELTFSLSDGVVSALDRGITLSDGSKINMIQTNCTINSGNSGGPLFNLHGEVIGIVSAKYSNGGDPFSGGASVEGLGFAIPINDVGEMIRDIIQNGYVTGKPYLGISVRTVDAQSDPELPKGAKVIIATPTLCAAKAGIQEGDVITAVGDVKVTGKEELIQAKNAYKAGETVNFTVYRQGQTKVIAVTMDEENLATSKAHMDYQEQWAKEHGQGQQEQQQAPNQGQIPEEFFGGGGLPFPFF